MSKIAILIDGGHVRAWAKKARLTYDAAFIAKLSLKCRLSTESVQRVLYYDCAPYTGSPKRPISGKKEQFTGSDHWLKELSRCDLFAVRLGVLKFRGWVPNKIPLNRGENLVDSDFSPNFEQKGVDMRIGLDMANYAANKSVDAIELMTNDTDCIPAMKYARRSGLQVVLLCIPGFVPAPDLLSHSDRKRDVSWPET